MQSRPPPKRPAKKRNHKHKTSSTAQTFMFLFFIADCMLSLRIHFFFTFSIFHYVTFYSFISYFFQFICQAFYSSSSLRCSWLSLSCLFGRCSGFPACLQVLFIHQRAPFLGGFFFKSVAFLLSLPLVFFDILSMSKYCRSKIAVQQQNLYRYSLFFYLKTCHTFRYTKQKTFGLIL